uniref:Ubiquitin carboxyl-terminal hydrolase n=1 Tax=Meloidogyne hapla TaxID=6305 RepID=A0A1I8BAJ8_MELHA
MERRSSRPYLRQNGTDSIDKFLKNINLSNNYNEKYTSKFPTDGLEGVGSSKYPSYSTTSVGKYSPASRINTASSSAAPSNYSSRYDVPTEERRRSSGLRAPLYNLTKNSTYNPRNYGADGVSRFAQGGCNDYAAQRTGSIHTVNGHLPSYTAPITHRRSSSSIGFINESRPLPSSSTFNSARDSIVKRSSTVLPFNVDYSRPSTCDSLDSSLKEVQRRTGEISISKADKRPPLPTTTKFTQSEYNNHPSMFISDTSNIIFDRQIAQKRPITPDEILSPTLTSDINSKTIIPCLKGLLNHGNTCYFSAIIQCLAACERFAEFLICDDSESSDLANKYDENDLSKAFVDTIRCLWFNNPSADSFCLKTLRFIGQANPQFIISHQQDSHECLIWLLNKLHEETKGHGTKTNINKSTSKLRTYKSEEELASDALEKISGSHESTVMDLFRGQLRAALKCTNPVCGFTNLSFEPYVLDCAIILCFSFLSYPNRQIIRFYFAVPEASLTVKHFNNNIMEYMNGSADETVSFIIKPNGLIQLLGDDFVICADNRLELNIFELPKVRAKDDMVICLVVFVIGTLPDCERFENPFVAMLSKHWNYAIISNFLLNKCLHLLPYSFQPLPQDYNIFVQVDNSLEALNPQTKRPLFHDSVERILNDINNPKRILRIIIEWDLSLKHQFLSNVAPEPILNDYTFFRKGADYDSKQFPISLKNLIDGFVETESIPDWACPKCKKSPGLMELCFHSLPDVLVFHLKRFELLSESVTKKIDSRVKIPLENLDMSPYVYNQHSKSSTLPKNKKIGNNAFNCIEKNSMIYDLAGVIYHYGERTNSGHYTAVTRNPVDEKWRIFDDSRVSTLADSVTGASELQISSRSYLLFYQRRPLVHRKLNWFPQNVPENIIKKYQQRLDVENMDRSYADGNSIFYKVAKNSDPTFNESTIKSPTKSSTQERTIPIIRETRAGPAIGYISDFPPSSSNRLTSSRRVEPPNRYLYNH